jgi:hypothetical protein
VISVTQELILLWRISRRRCWWSYRKVSCYISPPDLTRYVFAVWAFKQKKRVSAIKGPKRKRGSGRLRPCFPDRRSTSCRLHPTPNPSKVAESMASGVMIVVIGLLSDNRQVSLMHICVYRSRRGNKADVAPIRPRSPQPFLTAATTDGVPIATEWAANPTLVRGWAYSDVGDFRSCKQGSAKPQRIERTFSDRSFRMAFIPREGLQYQDGEVWRLPRNPAVREWSIQTKHLAHPALYDRQRCALVLCSLKRGTRSTVV